MSVRIRKVKARLERDAAHDKAMQDCPECVGKGYIEWPSYGGMGREYGYTCERCEGECNIELEQIPDINHDIEEQ